MTTILLAIALLCGQTDQELAIALAIAINAPQPEQQSVVSESIKETAPKIEKQPAELKYRNETRYRMVRKKFCNGGRCYYRMVREPYQVKVPVASAATKSWPSYPTTPRQQPWTQGGRHITWRHLAQGEHAGKFNAAWLQSLTRAELEQLHADDHENKVHWSRVVRP